MSLEAHSKHVLCVTTYITFSAIIYSVNNLVNCLRKFFIWYLYHFHKQFLRIRKTFPTTTLIILLLYKAFYRMARMVLIHPKFSLIASISPWRGRLLVEVVYLVNLLTSIRHYWVEALGGLLIRKPDYKPDLSDSARIGIEERLVRQEYCM